MRLNLDNIRVTKRQVLPVVLFCLAAGCAQQPQTNAGIPKTTSSIPSLPNVKSEVVIVAPPITAPAIPAKPMTQTPELKKEAAVLAAAPLIDPLTKNKSIQLALRNANFYTGQIDGKIGPLTKSAIRQFQTAKSLTADGIVGPRTWTELKRYLPEDAPSQNNP